MRRRSCPEIGRPTSLDAWEKTASHPRQSTVNEAIPSVRGQEIFGRSQQSETLKSTRRSIASLPSSLPVPIRFSLKPTPVPFNLPARLPGTPSDNTLLHLPPHTTT